MDKSHKYYQQFHSHQYDQYFIQKDRDDQLFSKQISSINPQNFDTIDAEKSCCFLQAQLLNDDQAIILELERLKGQLLIGKIQVIRVDRIPGGGETIRAKLRKDTLQPHVAMRETYIRTKVVYVPYRHKISKNSPPPSLQQQSADFKILSNEYTETTYEIGKVIIPRITDFFHSLQIKCWVFPWNDAPKIDQNYLRDEHNRFMELCESLFQKDNLPDKSLQHLIDNESVLADADLLSEPDQELQNHLFTDRDILDCLNQDVQGQDFINHTFQIAKNDD